MSYLYSASAATDKLNAVTVKNRLTDKTEREFTGAGWLLYALLATS